jgi:3-hydroxyacyl-CoA dehydrogenase/enoyl-CoA hydratase/3-hydroxybutyryl-CoA epimerase
MAAMATRCWRRKTSFAYLMVTPTAKPDPRLFLREQMKACGNGNKIEHVHIIGAGAMGGDIAAWCAGRDFASRRRHEGDRGCDEACADPFGRSREAYASRDALDRLIPTWSVRGAAPPHHRGVPESSS